jgi:hypothetical protein
MGWVKHHFHDQICAEREQGDEPEPPPTETCFVVCDACNGRGVEPPDENDCEAPCPICDGTGCEEVSVRPIRETDLWEF